MNTLIPYLPTGGKMHPLCPPLRYHGDAYATHTTPEQRKKLSAQVEVLESGLFGPEKFRLKNGKATVEHVCPDPYRQGWGRNPVADHWFVTRSDGRTFATQNYAALLRYLTLLTA